MAKINITFNNKNYSIDDTSLSAASAALKSHLSTVMNGTGATINLDGVAYGVDSTKLATATNAFVAHLGTVAGNGYKVKVGGVEYGVDAAKMTGAMSELEAVFGDLNSGGTGSDDINLPAIGISVQDCTWEEIKAIGDSGKASEYFNIGDVKTITLLNGDSIDMQIAAFNTDTISNTSDVAPITWISKHVNYNQAMNNSDTNKNGWKESVLRTWLYDYVLESMLPSDLTSVIINVDKTYYDYTTKSTLECSDVIWIPSYLEVFGEMYNESHGVYYSEYFKDSNSRIKGTYDGATGEEWWLRTADSAASQYFLYVKTSGTCGATAARLPKKIVFGFCT
jgi:hypothetical protein